jgi:hypothetical protein
VTRMRRLVVEQREDGSPHVLSLPMVGWEIYDRPRPQPSEQEASDEIRLMLADAGVIQEPLVTYDGHGEPRLTWPNDLLRQWQPIVDELAPQIRRARRARRARARRPGKSKTPAVRPQPNRKDDQPRLIEVEQRRDGRWQPIPSDASERLVIPASVLAAVRRHAVEVDSRQRGCESVGRIVVVDGRATRYVRLRNLRADAGVPGKMALGSSWRRVPGEANVIVHSHPRSGLGPSAGDLRWAAEYDYRRLFGTYSVPLGRLGIWRLDDANVPREIEFAIAS